MAAKAKQVIGRLRERQVCRSLDEVTLAMLPDHDLERALVEYVDERLARRGADEDEVGIVDALPPGVRALYLSWTVECEVINGGFVRYFCSWAGQFAAQAVTSFEFFSANEHAAVMREANRVYTRECGRASATDGCELIEAYESGRLHLLEDCFHQIDASLSALRIAKLRSDPRLFCDGCRGGDVAGA